MEFAGIEIYSMPQVQFDALVTLKNVVQLPVLGFNSYCTGDVPIVGEGFSEEKIAEYAEILCSRGEKLGIQSVGIGAPKARMLPKGYDRKKADLQAKSFLSITNRIAKDHGQMVLYEAVHKYMCGYCNFTQEAMEMVKDLNEDNIKMVLDFYHMAVMGEDITQIAYAMPYVKHLHVSHLGENYVRDYISEKDAGWLKEVFTALQSCGYDGTMSIEADIHDFEKEGPWGLEVLRKIAAEVK